LRALANQLWKSHLRTGSWSMKEQNSMGEVEES
jgi:hypothetical protein